MVRSYPNTIRPAMRRTTRCSAQRKVVYATWLVVDVLEDRGRHEMLGAWGDALAGGADAPRLSARFAEPLVAARATPGFFTKSSGTVAALVALAIVGAAVGRAYARGCALGTPVAAPLVDTNSLATCFGAIT